MAKYTRSPWGEIRGKLGEAVGSYYKGIKIVKTYRKEVDVPASLKKLNLYKKGKSSISITTMNRLMILTLLTHISKLAYRRLIFPVWSKEAKVKRKPLTPQNLFHKINLPILFQTLPNTNKFIQRGNSPDLSKLLISYGPVEPPSWFKSENKKGKIKLSWNPNPYSTGTPDDPLYFALIYWTQKSILRWSHKKKPWGKLIVKGDALNPIAKRGDGTILIDFPKRLKKQNIFCYIFAGNTRGYSISLGVKVGGISRFLA